MRFSTLATTGLLLTLGVVLPAQATANCWFTEGAIYCWDDNNAWRDRYDDRNYSEKWLSRNFLYHDIDQLYREVLGREVDASGYRTFSRRVYQGKSLKWVREKLASSDEAKQVINQVYRETLNRDADSSGLKTYTKQLRSGWSLEAVRGDILDSQEARIRQKITG